MISSSRHFALAVLFASLASAQDLSVTISPNPAVIGTTITVTATDASGQGLYTPFGCLLSSVRSGVPGGTTVKLFPCTFLGIAIPACPSPTPRTGTWNTSQVFIGGGVATPGLYWFEILKSIGPFGAISTEWHSVVLESGNAPALSAVNSPTWGSTFQLAINAPANSGEVYALAISASTNSGLAIAPGLHMSLDVDPLFNLSFPNPDAALFVNFQGFLDLSGAATGMAINIPPLFIGCVPLHVQAGMISPGGAISLTNDLHFTIQ